MKDKLFICNDCGKPTNNKSSLKMPFNNVVAIHRCDACQDKLDAKYEWQNEKFKEDNIICPWCEEEISDYEDMCEVTDEPYKINKSVTIDRTKLSKKEHAAYEKAHEFYSAF